MKVLYDHQIFEKQTYGGISRYFFELMNQYHIEKKINFKLSLVSSDNAYLKNASFVRHLPFGSNNLFRDGLSRITPAVNLQWSRLQISRGDFDLLHPTYYDLYHLKTRKHRPYVLTVHDMIQELYPEMFRGDDTAEKKKTAIQNADAIIAISKRTKEDILSQFDIDPHIIEVIYHGSSLDSVEPDTRLTLPERYIVFVGNRSIYKNFKFFIRSITPLILKDRTLYVVCAGGNRFVEEELGLLKGLGIADKVLHYPINDRILFRIYAGAEVFVFPSLYEGFGIPMLEAFGAGCPVAASFSSSLPEVGGNAARYFDPEDPASILTTVEEIISDKALQLALKEKGHQRFRDFSWKKTAEETRKVYEKLL
ncbi:D-inositol-3-phosphate glycosyltransferase [anaerobic digester metagenome]